MKFGIRFLSNGLRNMTELNLRILVLYHVISNVIWNFCICRVFPILQFKNYDSTCAMNTRDWVEIQFHSFLISALNGLSGQIQAPAALPPGSSLWYPQNSRLEDKSLSRQIGGGIDILLLLGIELRSFCCLARIVVIPTDLLCIFCVLNWRIVS